MAKKTKKAARKGRNRAAQDITLINLRALKKSVRVMRADITKLRARVIFLELKTAHL